VCMSKSPIAGPVGFALATNATRGSAIANPANHGVGEVWGNLHATPVRPKIQNLDHQLAMPLGPHATYSNHQGLQWIWLLLAICPPLAPVGGLGLLLGFIGLGALERTSSNDISALTGAVWSLVESKEQPTGQGTGGGKTGRGRKYIYCWGCGGNPTHWARQCRPLSKEDKREYRNANGEGTMGGSDKWVDCARQYKGDSTSQE